MIPRAVSHICDVRKEWYLSKIRELKRIVYLMIKIRIYTSQVPKVELRSRSTCVVLLAPGPAPPPRLDLNHPIANFRGRLLSHTPHSRFPGLVYYSTSWSWLFFSLSFPTNCSADLSISPTSSFASAAHAGDFPSVHSLKALRPSRLLCSSPLFIPYRQALQAHSFNSFSSLVVTQHSLSVFSALFSFDYLITCAFNSFVGGFVGKPIAIYHSFESAYYSSQIRASKCSSVTSSPSSSSSSLTSASPRPWMRLFM